MKFWRFFVCFITLTLWNWDNFAEAQSYNALFLNQNDSKLVEMNESKGSGICPTCISACPASSNANEKLINRHVSLSGNSIFFRKVYNNVGNANDIKTEICDQPLAPAIIWQTSLQIYAIGYEFYFKEGETELKSADDYANFNKVIGGVASEYQKRLPNNQFIKTHKEGAITKFQTLKQPREKFVFYWIQVFSVIESPKNMSHRQIVFTKDTINDYYLGMETTSQCESYFSGDSENTENDTIIAKQINAKARATTSGEIIENRLEKTQILPMHMFHTHSARLATCMYINMAFVWNTIANDRLKRIDLFLYSIYRLWPSQINIFFGVNGKSTKANLADTQEDWLFSKYPIPKVIYRVVEYRLGNETYDVLVVIHNDLDVNIPESERICTTPVEGWHEIDDTAKYIEPGLSYTCKLTEVAYEKLGIGRKVELKEVKELKLNEFPTLDSNGDFILENVSYKIYKELERIKQ